MHESFKYVKSSQTGHWNVLSRARCTGHGNDFELIPTVWTESQHSIGAPTCHDFPRFVIILEKSQPEVRNCWLWSSKTGGFFLKKDPLWANFQKIIPKECTTSHNHVLCANFVKVGWLEIRKVVQCFPDKKKTKIPQGLLLSLLRGLRPKSARASPKQYTRRVAVISSKSVHFRRSYSRTREHRSNAPQNISNTRRSFFAK